MLNNTRRAGYCTSGLELETNRIRVVLACVSVQSYYLVCVTLLQDCNAVAGMNAMTLNCVHVYMYYSSQ